MRAAVVRQWGAPESVTVEELADPEPGPGEVVVRVESAAVNYPDVLIAANQYQVSIPPPFTPGSEWAGVVERTGPGVTSRAVGDRVSGGGIVGAFAQKLIAPETVARIPDGVSYDAAAAFSVVYGTAYSVLRSVAEVQPGEWVAVLGAAGGVGLATVDLAILLGAPCPGRGVVARQVGGVPGAGRRGGRRLRPRTAEGAHEGDHRRRRRRGRRSRRRHVLRGCAARHALRLPLRHRRVPGRDPPYPAQPRPAEGCPRPRLRGPHLRRQRAQLLARDREELQQLYESARVAPYIGATFDLDDVAAALRLMGDRGAIGKIIIHPWSEGGRQ